MSSPTEKYKEAALRTEATSFNTARQRLSRTHTLRLLHAALGLADEAGEFVKPIKAHIFYGQPIEPTNLIEELGDVCWFTALALDALGVSWEDCLAKNLAKLRRRYPERFSESNAIERDLQAERSALEETE